MNDSIWSFESFEEYNTGTVTRFAEEYMSNYAEPEEVEGVSFNREHEISKAFIDRMKDRKKLNSFLKKYHNLANIKEANMDEFVWLYVTEGCNDVFSDTNKIHILTNVYRHLLNYVI